MGGLHLVAPRAMAPTVSAHGLSANRLLAALPAADLERWRMHLEWTEMPLGQVLYESGSAPRDVYFPATAIVALLYVMENGASAEIAVVGNDGLVGISVFMGGLGRLSRSHAFRRLFAMAQTPLHVSAASSAITIGVELAICALSAHDPLHRVHDAGGGRPANVGGQGVRRST